MGDRPEEKAEALLEILEERHPLVLTDRELALLEREVSCSALANKLLATHHFNASDLERARLYAERAFGLGKEPDAAKNLLSVYSRLERFDEALAFAQENGACFEPVELHDALCWINWRVGRYDISRAHGLKSLSLKNAEAKPTRGEDLGCAAEDREPVGEREISFSLFGTASRYIEGAIRNAVVARHLYPGWRPRFFVDGSVPDAALDALKQEGARIHLVEDPALAQLGTFWRFLIEDVSAVGLYVVRDCDSVINIKERAAVEDWLHSEKPFHVMRDHPTHCELMLAGMWGARRGKLGPMREKILRFAASGRTALNDHHLDQKFLRREVWPLVRDHAFVNDEWFAYDGGRPYRTELTLPRSMHIGQNDAHLRATGRRTLGD